MGDPLKNLTQKKILGLILVFLGFLGAFLTFEILSKDKPKEVVSQKTTIPPSLTKKQATLPSSTSTATQTQPVPNPMAPNVPVQNVVMEKQISPQELKELSSTKKNIIKDEITKREIPRLILNGLFASEKESYALINNRIVKEGDVVSGATVKHIYSNKVELEIDGQQITLRVK